MNHPVDRVPESTDIFLLSPIEHSFIANYPFLVIESLPFHCKLYNTEIQPSVMRFVMYPGGVYMKILSLKPIYLMKTTDGVCMKSIMKWLADTFSSVDSELFTFERH